jgi:hypothetical protein
MSSRAWRNALPLAILAWALILLVILLVIAFWHYLLLAGAAAASWRYLGRNRRRRPAASRAGQLEAVAAAVVAWNTRHLSRKGAPS